MADLMFDFNANHLQRVDYDLVIGDTEDCNQTFEAIDDLLDARYGKHTALDLWKKERLKATPAWLFVKEILVVRVTGKLREQVFSICFRIIRVSFVM